MNIFGKLNFIFLVFAGSIFVINGDKPTSYSFQCDAPTHPDYAPLMALYNATDGDNWNNNSGWDVDCDVCEWYGISCRSGRVWRVSLFGNGLNGALPPELAGLTELEELIVFSNNISGPFPSFLKVLPLLDRLQIGGNALSGTIPSDISEFPSLQFLDLHDNAFTGEINPEIFEIPTLNNLDLSDNTLEGQIPLNINNAANLFRLVLKNCGLSGNIPVQIYDLANLVQLQLQENNFDGVIAPEIGNLQQLETFYIQDNQLTGLLPSTIGQLTSLETFFAQNNQFNGAIPDAITNLSNLRSLNLRNNNLSGSLPIDLGNLTSLTSLRIAENNLSGEIPPSIGNLIELAHLTIFENEFEGEFPEEFGNLPSLVHLSARTNKFTGCFPDSYFNECSTFTDITFSGNCTFENPRFTEFCAGAECTNDLELAVNSFSLCEGEEIDIAVQATYSYSYEWSEPGGNGRNFNTTATESKYFAVTLTNSRGCTKADSVFIEVVSSEPGEEAASICPGGSTEINGETFDMIGIFNQSIPRPGTCDSTVIVTITESEGTFGSFAASTCPGNTVEVNGEPFAPGLHSQVIQNQAGCDSTISISINAFPEYMEALEFAVCEGQTHHFDGQELGAGGHQVSYQTVNGCDSIFNISIIESEGSFGVYAASTCPGNTVEVNGENFAPGNHSQVIQNQAGCDSTINITIDVYPEYLEALEFTVCEGQTYNFDGQELGAGGHQVSYQTVNGCDSIFNINITSTSSTNGEASGEICEGQTINLAGVDFTAGGLYTVELTNANGCDSIVTVNVVEKPSSLNVLNEVICQGSSIEINDFEYSEAGNYEVVLTNSLGCDSTIILNLEVISGDDQVIDYTICQGQSYAFAGVNYTETVTVQDSLIIDGCRSLTTLNLTVIEPSYFEFTKTICEGEQEYFFGQFISESGSYQKKIQNQQFCDSIVTMHLEVEEPIEVTLDTTICDGGSILIGGINYNTAGIYEQNNQSFYGCDSTTIVNIEIFDNEIEYYQEFVCDGEEVLLYGNYYGAGQHTGTHFNGICYQDFEITVAELARITSNETQIICEGGSVEFMDQVYTEGGQYEINMDINDCEWLQNLFILESGNENELSPQIFCEGAEVSVNGSVVNQSGIYEVSQGADCTETYVSLLFISGEIINLDGFITDDVPFEFNGQQYEEEGIFEVLIGTEHGCETLVTLNIIKQTCGGVRAENLTICAGESLDFYGVEITAEGTYEHRKNLGSSCDSIIELLVNVAAEVDFEIQGENVVCDGTEVELSGPEGYEYLWSTGSANRSITTNEVGTYELTIFDVNNCPSYQTIEITSVDFPSEVIDIFPTDPSTCEGSDGEILIDFVEVGNYLYSIDGGNVFQQNNLFTNLPNGNYDIVLSDLNQHCFKALSSPVILESMGVPQIESVDVVQINDCIGQLGSIEIIPEEIGYPYIFSIDNGEHWSENGYFDNLESGSYTVLMKVDGSSCVNNLSSVIDIKNIANLQAEVVITSELSCSQANDGMANIQINAGQEPFMYQWSNGASGAIAENLSAGSYEIVVKDANGCEQTLSLDLEGTDVLELISPFADTTICAEGMIEYDVDSNFNYVLFRNDLLYYEGNSPVIEENGDYQIIVENGTECIEDQFFNVSEVDLSEFGIDFLLSTESVKDVQVVAVNISDPMPSDFQWIINGNVESTILDDYSEAFTFKDTGTYELQLLTDIDGCLSSLTKTIVIYPDSSYLGSYEEPSPPLDLERFGSWKIFPNPNDGNFSVEIESISHKLQLMITVFDVFGGKIEERELSGSQQYLESFNLASAGNGIYTVMLSAQNQKFYKNILIVK